MGQVAHRSDGTWQHPGHLQCRQRLWLHIDAALHVGVDKGRPIVRQTAQALLRQQHAEVATTGRLGLALQGREQMLGL